MAFPSTYAAYVPLNRLAQLDRMRFQTLSLVQSLLVSPELVGGSPRLLEDDGTFAISEDSKLTIEEYIAAFDPARLGGLTLRGVYAIQSDIYTSERNQENIRRQGMVYGYGEAQDLVMVYELDGRLFQHSCQLARFEKGWQITSFSSPIYGLSSFGNAVPLSDSDWQALEASGDYARLYTAG